MTTLTLQWQTVPQPITLTLSTAAACRFGLFVSATLTSFLLLFSATSASTLSSADVNLLFPPLTFVQHRTFMQHMTFQTVQIILYNYNITDTVRNAMQVLLCFVWQLYSVTGTTQTLTRGPRRKSLESAAVGLLQAGRSFRHPTTSEHNTKNVVPFLARLWNLLPLSVRIADTDLILYALKNHAVLQSLQNASTAHRRQFTVTAHGLLTEPNLHACLRAYATYTTTAHKSLDELHEAARWVIQVLNRTEVTGTNKQQHSDVFDKPAALLPCLPSLSCLLALVESGDSTAWLGTGHFTGTAQQQRQS